MPLSSFDPVAAGQARLATREPVGSKLASLGQQSDGHRCREPVAAHQTIPTPVPSRAPRAPAQGELDHVHRMAHLQHFRIRNARVGHVAVNARSPVEIRPGPSAASDGLVVAKALVAKGDVVHGALAGRHQSQRAEQRVDDTLRGLHVAAHHRRARGRIQNRAPGNAQLHRIETAPVQGDALGDQRAKYIDQSRLDDGSRRIQVARNGLPGAFEVDDHALAFDLQPHADGRAVVQSVFEAGAAIGELSDLARHLGGSRPLQLRHGDAHAGQALLARELRQQRLAAPIRRHHGLEIGEIVFRATGGMARPGQQRAHARIVDATVAHQPHRFQQHALLLEAARVGRQRAGRDAADIGVVPAAGDEEVRTALGRGPCCPLPRLPLGKEHRSHHGDVRQVRAPGERVIGHDRVPRLQIRKALEHRTHRFAHGAQVHRNVWSIGHQPASPIEDRARVVQALLDVRGHRRVAKHDSHLLRHRHEAIAEDLEPHRIHTRQVRAPGP